MSRYSDLTIDELRHALDHMELNYGLAMDGQAYGLAEALKDKIDGLMGELIAKLQAEDPYTSEADVRYFEGRGHDGLRTHAS